MKKILLLNYTPTYFYLQKHTEPPVSLIGQLLWREFYYTVGAGTPNFDRMEGNRVCTQVDWDENMHYLEAWKMVLDWLFLYTIYVVC